MARRFEVSFKEAASGPTVTHAAARIHPVIGRSPQCQHHRRQRRALRPILPVKCTHPPGDATTNNRCSAVMKDPVLAFDSGMAALSF